MGNHNWDVAQKITSAFRAELSEEAVIQISEAQFNELTQMISQAIAEELSSAAAQVEALAHKLQAAAEKSELGL